MIDRYARPEMTEIWSEVNKIKIWYEIEAYACEGQAKLGLIPKQAAQAIRRILMNNVSFVNV